MMRSEKSKANDLVLMGLSHECFTHERLGTFDITTMLEHARRGLYGKPYQADLTPELASHFMTSRDFELMRVWELLNDPRGPVFDEPALCIFIEHEESHMFVDGTHRILGRWMLGLPEFLFYMVNLRDAPRPPRETFEIADTWGSKEVRGGKVYDRATGELWKVPR